MIASDAVAKHVVIHMSELESMELVRLSTSIPVPRGIKFVHISRADYLLVQQYIPGRALSAAWPAMSWWRRFRSVLTMRYYVYELSLLSSRIGAPTHPGPLSPGGLPQLCTGWLFNESGGSGPFNNYTEMSRWHQKRLLVMQRYQKASMDVVQFDDKVPLVFTHMDLHMDNVIVGDDEQLWLVDRGSSG